LGDADGFVHPGILGLCPVQLVLVDQHRVVFLSSSQTAIFLILDSLLAGWYTDCNRLSRRGHTVRERGASISARKIEIFSGHFL
jgi:hypothetical protein